MNILITGLPGSGKTTLAHALAPLIGATVFDGDDIRATYPVSMGFTPNARVKHAEHMGALCRAVTASGNHAIASFICPTAETRRAFGADFTIWCDALPDGRFRDTERMWEDPPAGYALRATKAQPPYYWAERAAAAILPAFNPMLSTALLVGRFQPFHAGHKWMAERAMQKHGQVCFGVRDHSREYPFHFVKARIDAAMQEHRGRYTVIAVPNITAVCYGRDVGYAIEQLAPPPQIAAISATAQRETGGLPSA